MSNYNIKLTPDFIDPTTEGSLADLIRVVLENLADNHPLVVNMRNRQS